MSPQNIQKGGLGGWGKLPAMLLSGEAGLNNIGIASLWFDCPIPGVIWELRVTFEFLSVLTLDVKKNNLKFPSIIIIISLTTENLGQSEEWMAGICQLAC